MSHFRLLLISLSVAQVCELAVRPCCAILKKLRSAALAEVQLPEHLARASMMGPLWLSPGQVFQVTVTVEPAVTGISVVPAVADLWQAMSEVPKEFGGTKPMSWLSANQPAFCGLVEE